MVPAAAEAALRESSAETSMLAGMVGAVRDAGPALGVTLKVGAL